MSAPMPEKNELAYEEYSTMTRQMYSEKIRFRLFAYCPSQVIPRQTGKMQAFMLFIDLPGCVLKNRDIAPSVKPGACHYRKSKTLPNRFTGKSYASNSTDRMFHLLREANEH
jgi:hypothetical protein